MLHSQGLSNNSYPPHILLQIISFVDLTHTTHSSAGYTRVIKFSVNISSTS